VNGRDKDRILTFVVAHGGGFILGDLDSEDSLCRMVVEHSQMAVVSMDYRLSPEVKAPVHINDCWKVYQWVSRFDNQLQEFHTN
jgi:acetyl esterase/lipase